MTPDSGFFIGRRGLLGTADSSLRQAHGGHCLSLKGSLNQVLNKRMLRPGSGLQESRLLLLCFGRGYFHRGQIGIQLDQFGQQRILAERDDENRLAIYAG